MRRLDRIIISTLVGLVLVIGLLGFFVFYRGVPPAQVSTPAGDGLVGGQGPVLLKFSADMDHASVEDGVSFVPAWPGKWTWVNDREVWFYPASPLPPGTQVQVNLPAGLKANIGMVTRQAETQSFTVRDLRLAYVKGPTYGGELWTNNLAGTDPVQLTNSQEGVYDFIISPDGEKIIYSLANLNGGTDLVVMNRDGSGARTLLSCGAKSCLDLAWAPDNTGVAYSQYDGGLNSALSSVTSEIYVVDTSSGQDNPLFINEGVYGIEPSFSPDGKYVAYYDLSQRGICIVDLNDGGSSVVPTPVEQVGSWSPDSQRMVFADLAPEALVPYDQLYVVNLANQQVDRLDDRDISNLDYSLPEWSPDGKWLLVGVQSTDSQATPQLWLMQPDGKLTTEITQDQLAVHAAYHWSPDGGQIAYQQLELGSDNPTPQVFLWDMNTGQTTLVADDAGSPAWMP